MTPEQRAARVHHHMYETCEGIAEHAERIVRLEELVSKMLIHIKEVCDLCDEDYCNLWDGENGCCTYEHKARELGIEEGE